ncbi:twin-arginine translocase subunit TatC [Ruania suaedae]|uniref:twin-arginine translocase subunit TatC n=1 Tax=Ruania suaedae TaxID=2897774 RepID=UPI001E60204D|nr:twin-arginine translocase subunit TatC [Ruania suaedae]UFU04533.1 twin-arginine translocase subunit TatC [Ruania suaedae]
MPLGDHLRELRKRLVLAFIGILLGAIGGWFLYDVIYGLLQQPVEELRARGVEATLNFDSVASSFDIKLRVAGFLGLIVSCPWWIYHLWAFLAPGLKHNERRWTLAVIGAGVPLFAGGVYMAWLALPNTYILLTQFVPEGETSSLFIGVTDYLKFVMQFLLIFGFAFLLPLILVVLNFLGVVKGITWLKGWRWAVIVIFVLSALATPTADVVTFILMALPIVVLYFAAVGICLLNDRRRARKSAKEEAELDDALADGASSSADAER